MADIMSGITKIFIAVFILCAIMATGMAFAFMPTERGVSCPQTVWGDRGIKGSVSGMVVTSLDQSKGIGGAYVAVVNPMSPTQEYANTTSDANGEFHINGLNATYSSVLSKGPDGSAGSYQQGMNLYMIYVNKTSLGEGYSGSFGIDTNHTNTAMGPVVIYAGVPDAGTVTPEPTATAQPTAVATPVPATATPTATPAPEGISLSLIAAVLVLAAILAVAVYILVRKK